MAHRTGGTYRATKGHVPKGFRKGQLVRKPKK